MDAPNWPIDPNALYSREAVEDLTGVTWAHVRERFGLRVVLRGRVLGSDLLEALRRIGNETAKPNKGRTLSPVRNARKRDQSKDGKKRIAGRWTPEGLGVD